MKPAQIILALVAVSAVALTVIANRGSAGGKAPEQPAGYQDAWDYAFIPFTSVQEHSPPRCIFEGEGIFHGMHGVHDGFAQLCEGPADKLKPILYIPMQKETIALPDNLNIRVHHGLYVRWLTPSSQPNAFNGMAALASAFGTVMIESMYEEKGAVGLTVLYRKN